MSFVVVETRGPWLPSSPAFAALPDLGPLCWLVAARSWIWISFRLPRFLPDRPCSSFWIWTWIWSVACLSLSHMVASWCFGFFWVHACSFLWAFLRSVDRTFCRRSGALLRTLRILGRIGVLPPGLLSGMSGILWLPARGIRLPCVLSSCILCIRVVGVCRGSI